MQTRRFIKPSPKAETVCDQPDIGNPMQLSKKFWPWLFILTACASFHVSAARLDLLLQDDKGKPVSGVVASLIPENKPDFSDKARGVMDQRNNQFTPGVLAIRVNTLVYFPNSDNVRHHVYSFSPAKRFELRLYHGLTADPVLFDKPGLVVLGCNIHDSMVGYIYVVDSDLFAINDDKGQLVINNVPAGIYTLQIQHPKLAQPYPDQKIVIAADQVFNKKIVLTGFVAEEKADPDSLNSLFK